MKTKHNDDLSDDAKIRPVLYEKKIRNNINIVAYPPTPNLLRRLIERSPLDKHSNFILPELYGGPLPYPWLEKSVLFYL